jgi:ubiquinone/menaquinone biosynthesis C-methylase UbiE
MLQEALGKDYDTERIAYKIADVENLPFDDASFDTVVDTFSLQSYYDRNKAISEIKRVLKPQGKLLVIGRGASTISLYNQYIQFRAGQDIKQEGLVHHLDFEKIFKNDPDFEVEYLERRNLGMTHIMILRKVIPEIDSEDLNTETISEKVI